LAALLARQIPICPAYQKVSAKAGVLRVRLELQLAAFGKDFTCD
jgi:hypothetical protein